MRICPACRAHFEAKDWSCPSCGNRPPSDSGFNILMLGPAIEEQPREVTFETRSFARLAAAEASCFWFQGRNELIVWAVRRYFPEAGSLLEVGCGTGFVLSALSEAFPEVRLVGGDYYTAGLAFARGRLPGIELNQLDARELPFENEFDAVGAFDVIEHVREDELVLAQMNRSLRPGGGLLLTVPQHPRMWSKADEYGHHQRRYRRRELVEKVQRAGFEIVRLTSFVSLLLPAMVGSRILGRYGKGEREPMVELTLPRVVDRAMRGVFRAETATIRAGISFPAGGSLLLVARK
jgi:SAM-dependent methyltransferase